MIATLLDGKALAAAKQAELRQAIITSKIKPHLAVVLIGDDSASTVYVNTKQVCCEKVGIQTTGIYEDSDIPEEDLHNIIKSLNQDKDIHGILIQLPLPEHIDTDFIMSAIAPEKDVDGFHPSNQGRLLQKNPALRPCTPYGIMQLLDHYQITVEGKEAVVIGASNIVGRPMAIECLNKQATVTLCHSRTTDLIKHCQRADILISATGNHHMIKKDWVKQGAVVIDVGITRLNNGQLVGDVDTEQVQQVASYITPVPGGVGPMTVTALLQNTVQACRQMTLQTES